MEIAVIKDIRDLKEYIKNVFGDLVSETEKIISDHVVVDYVYDRLSSLFDSPTLTDPENDETYDYKWDLFRILEKEVIPALKLMKTTQDSYKDYDPDAQREILEKAIEMATK